MDMRKLLRNIFYRAGLLEVAERAFGRWVAIKGLAELRLLLPVLDRSGLLRRFYFAFFSNTFSAEMRQYINGRYFYLRKSRGQSFNESLLRRNIHRLEKGLMAEERKSIFATEYIYETVEQFSASVTEKSFCVLNDWAYDILNEYFSIIESRDVVKRAWEKFNNTSYSKQKPEISKLPHEKRAVEPKAYEHFVDLVNIRKSVRSFVPGSIPPRELVEQAVRLASSAPSSCNRQPFRFVILEKNEDVVAVSQLAGGARSFAEGIPALAIVVGSTSVSPSPGDRHLMYIDGSLAGMNFMLALESQGVSSCPINWPDNKKPEKALRKMIKLEKYERPVMLIAMGKAAETGLVACSVRKEVSEILQFYSR
jgi:nitroreductase